MARPQIEINKSDFEKLCGLQCGLEEIAGWYKCSVDTVERWCKRTYGKGFAEAYKEHSANGKIGLRRMQYKLAEKSAVMAIWLGKQWLGQKEYVETKTEGKVVIVDNINEEEAEEYADESTDT